MTHCRGFRGTQSSYPEGEIRGYLLEEAALILGLEGWTGEGVGGGEGGGGGGGGSVRGGVAVGGTRGGRGGVGQRSAGARL